MIVCNHISKLQNRNIFAYNADYTPSCTTGYSGPTCSDCDTGYHMEMETDVCINTSKRRAKSSLCMNWLGHTVMYEIDWIRHLCMKLTG